MASFDSRSERFGCTRHRTVSQTTTLPLCTGRVTERCGSAHASASTGSRMDAQHRRRSGRSFRVDIVLSLLEERSGVLWIGTRHGLFRVDRGRVTRITTKDGLHGNYVAALAHASDGGVWVGTRGGIAHVKDGRVRRIAAPPEIGPRCHSHSRKSRRRRTGLAPTVRASRVSTTAAGASTVCAKAWPTRASLLCMTTAAASGSRRGRASIVSATADCPATRRRAVSPPASCSRWSTTEAASCWLTSQTGISMVDTRSVDDLDAGRRQTLIVTAYDKADGMKTSECNNGVQPATWRTEDGRLWFSTVKGLAVIDPANLRTNTKPPPVLIEQVRVDDEPVPLGEAIALPPGRTRPEFHYTALSFYAPSKVRFRYKLEGFDPDWIDAGPRRVGYYTNVPPGRYRFRVIASNEDGVWNRAGAALDFTMRARFYRTPTFAMRVRPGVCPDDSCSLPASRPSADRRIRGRARGTQPDRARRSMTRCAELRRHRRSARNRCEDAPYTS